MNEHIRYEPDEQCPPVVTIGVALQGIMLVLANTVLMVTITVRAADQSERYLTWAVFAAMIIGGIVTALQAARLGRLGAGHILMSGASPHFVAISVLALTKGGQSLLVLLIVVSSLFQFALAAWLPRLRRIITPVVAGTSLMLIALTVMPVAFNRLTEVNEGESLGASLAVAGVTLATSAALAMRASGVWRLWAPLIGITVGSVAAALAGLYDAQRVLDAPWVALPDVSAWPGLDLRPTEQFWALLPVFVAVTLVVAIKTSGDGVVIQNVSRRRPRAIDFRLVQGTLNANGVGSLLAGLSGTPPTVAYSPSSISLINFTGVAARSVGYAIGIMLVGLAFLPKIASLLLAVPSAVMGVFLLTIMGLLFVEGMRMVVQDGLDHRKALVAGVALGLGVGLQHRNVAEELLGETLGASLGNSMTIGIVAAILLTAFIELTSPRVRRLDAEVSTAALPAIDTFLSELAARIGWNDASRDRLRAAGEETLASLAQIHAPGETGSAPRLIVLARPGDGAVEMEFLAVLEEQNIEDWMAHLGDQAETLNEETISLRLLRHYAAAVRHRKYHGIDIVTVQVKGSR